MAEFPAMPFWFDAYYRDTQHLTYEEHGIYLHIIKLLWHAPGQRIPYSVSWLGRRFKEHTPQAVALISEFCQRDGKWITQSKVMREFQYVAEKKERQREIAKSRWNKEKDICHGIAVAMPPTPTPNREESKRGSSKEKEATNGNGKGRGKPRHQQMTKDHKRIWLDAGTDDFVSYAADYWDKHHAPVVLLWSKSGAWFNLRGE